MLASNMDPADIMEMGRTSSTLWVVTCKSNAKGTGMWDRKPQCSERNPLGLECQSSLARQVEMLDHHQLNAQLLGRSASLGLESDLVGLDDGRVKL
jgi:hypothetical protein